jgi:magnesium transporter
LWIRLLGADEAAEVIQEAGKPEREGLLSLLDDKTRRETRGLLDYADEEAKGSMNPSYVRLRPQMSLDEAISFLRRDARSRASTIYYAYVIDSDDRLLGVVSFRDLLTSPGNKTVQEIMRRDVITAPEGLDNAALADILTRYNLQMIPVVDSTRRIKAVIPKEKTMPLN